jgi:hypothetical protein
VFSVLGLALSSTGADHSCPGRSWAASWGRSPSGERDLADIGEAENGAARWTGRSALGDVLGRESRLRERASSVTPGAGESGR